MSFHAGVAGGAAVVGGSDVAPGALGPEAKVGVHDRLLESHFESLTFKPVEPIDLTAYSKLVFMIDKIPSMIDACAIETVHQAADDTKTLMKQMVKSLSKALGDLKNAVAEDENEASKKKEA